MKQDQPSSGSTHSEMPVVGIIRQMRDAGQELSDAHHDLVSAIACRLEAQPWGKDVNAARARYAAVEEQARSATGAALAVLAAWGEA